MVLYFDGADDRFKNKPVKEEDAISIAVLKQIIEESMRVFWEYLHADKHEDSYVLKRFHSTKLNHQDAAAHIELLMDIKSKLQKVCFYFYLYLFTYFKFVSFIYFNTYVQ